MRKFHMKNINYKYNFEQTYKIKKKIEISKKFTLFFGVLISK